MSEDPKILRIPDPFEVLRDQDGEPIGIRIVETITREEFARRYPDRVIPSIEVKP